MIALRVIGWSIAGLVVACVVFLAATIRVVEPDVANPSRPALSAAAAPVPTAQPVAPTMPEVPAPALIVPVPGVDIATLRSNWGDPRGGGARTHQGLDIMAPGGTPVRAAADGTVEKLYRSNGGGGIALYQRSGDGRWMFYYAHLGGYAPGMADGRRVQVGETIGYVGDTGNAGAGNHHLHFGVSAMRPGERWWQGTPVDPYPLLAAKPIGG